VANAWAEPLFDDFERIDDSPALYSESTYSFLNRAAGERWSRIRSLLEDWLADYPDEHKDQLRFAAYFNARIGRPPIPVKTFPECENHIGMVHIVKYYRL
jgi:hypothetical protein